MVPLHAQPSSAAQEIDALYDVYTDVVNKWATNVSGSGVLGSCRGEPGGLGRAASRQLSWAGCVPRETSRTRGSGCHLSNVQAGSCWLAPLPLPGACPPMLGSSRGVSCCPLRFQAALGAL